MPSGEQCRDDDRVTEENLPDQPMHPLAGDLARTARSAILSLPVLAAKQADWNHG